MIKFPITTAPFEGAIPVTTGTGGHPIYGYQELYKGCTLKISEHNGRDDSDFFAHCWNEERQEIVEVCYASTRFWTYDNIAYCDATEDVLNNVYDVIFKENVEHIREKKNVIEKDDIVKVVAGKKIKHGTIGKVFWKGHDKFTQNRFSAKKIRFGVQFEDGEKIFMDGKNLQRIETKDLSEVESEILSYAKYLTEKTIDVYRKNSQKCLR